jgi:hypothetical protein
VIPATLDHRITNSQRSCAMTCLRKHFLSYVLGIRRDEDAKPLRMGSAYHLGLEAHGRGQGADPSVLAAVAAYDTRAPETFANDEHAADWLVEREVVARLLTGYFWRWSEMDAQMQVLACEVPFEIPIVNPASGRSSRTYTLAGKIDKIVRLPDGRIAVMEHKTTGDDLAPESDYWRRLRIDSQISVYMLGARSLGFEAETVLYDVARKPTTSPRSIPVLDADGLKIVVDANGERVRTKDGKRWRQSGDAAEGLTLQSRPETAAEYGDRLTTDIAARPDWYYARREIPRLHSDLDEARHDLWHTAQIIHECHLGCRWPKNTSACIGFGRCGFFDLCTTGFDPATMPLPEGFKIVTDRHQELTVE